MSQRITVGEMLEQRERHRKMAAALLSTLSPEQDAIWAAVALYEIAEGLAFLVATWAWLDGVPIHKD